MLQLAPGAVAGDTVHAIAVPGGQQGFGIEVLNLSAFPVTVIDVKSPQ
jgi:hypothetical protein